MVFDILLFNRALEIHSLIGILLVMLPTGWLLLRRKASVTAEPPHIDPQVAGGEPS